MEFASAQPRRVEESGGWRRARRLLCEGDRRQTKKDEKEWDFSHFHGLVFFPHRAICRLGCFTFERLGLGGCNFQNGLQAAPHVSIRRRPGRHADSHRLSSFPICAAAPTGTFILNGLDNAASSLVASKRDQDLIQDNIVEYFVSCSP